MGSVVPRGIGSKNPVFLAATVLALPYAVRSLEKGWDWVKNP